MKSNYPLLLLLLLTALAAAGCKKVYMVPASSGWVEEEIDDGGDTIKYKPAEKFEVDYD